MKLYLLIFSLFLFSLVSVGQDLIPFEDTVSGLWGFRNRKTGAGVIEPKFDEAEEFSHGQVWVKKSDGSFLIDEKEKISVSLVYDGVWYFSEGLGEIKQDNIWGFIDKIGKVVIPLIYDVRPFSEELGGVKQDDKWGFVNKKGVSPYSLPEFSSTILLVGHKHVQ